MKMKMKAIAVAVGLAMAGGANAAIENSVAGNGELFFTVWDSSSKVAFTADLGVNLNDFLVGNAPSFASYNFGADANWTTFVANSTTSNLQWMVGAGDSFGSGAGGIRYATTSASPNPTAPSTTNLGAFNLSDGFLSVVNTKGTLASLADGGTAYTTQAADGNAYPDSNILGNDWGNKAPFSSTAAIGTAQNFYLFSAAASGISKATRTDYAYDWNMTSTGVLTYGIATPPPAVPVPAAVWLLGSALIGMVGVARRKTVA